MCTKSDTHMNGNHEKTPESYAGPTRAILASKQMPALSLLASCCENVCELDVDMSNDTQMSCLDYLPFAQN